MGGGWLLPGRPPPQPTEEAEGHGKGPLGWGEAHTKQTRPHDAHIQTPPRGMCAHMFRVGEEEGSQPPESNALKNSINQTAVL